MWITEKNKPSSSAGLSTAHSITRIRTNANSYFPQAENSTAQRSVKLTIAAHEKYHFCLKNYT
jgi:hypothetical protein